MFMGQILIGERSCTSHSCWIVALLAASAVQAETIEMKVNGLVCGFCARGIEKTLRKESGDGPTCS
jgi:hypothetical protein